MIELKRHIGLDEIAEVVGGTLEGAVPTLGRVAPLNDGVNGVITFCRDSGRELNCEDCAVLVPPDYAGKTNRNAVIRVRNPRLGWAHFLQWLVDESLIAPRWPESWIAPTAKLAPSAVVMGTVKIGHGVVVEPNATIFGNVEIGDRSVIRAGAVIGGTGFGYETDTDGKLFQMPHVGGVTIGADVDVGSCTCVARGVMAETVVEDGVKIDNLVHVAHNCVIKRGALVIACAELSGGVVVGEGAWVAPGVSVKQKVSIGRNSVVGLAAVVLNDVPEGTTVIGNPAKPLIKK